MKVLLAVGAVVLAVVFKLFELVIMVDLAEEIKAYLKKKH